jgi:3-hydroxyacyl-CoA dehydrogenase
MSRRREVQQLKRDVARDGSIEAILALLGRSVRMGHKILQEGVASAADIDEGMKLGCGQPIGPLMDTLSAGFDDTKYRAAPLLREMVDGGRLGKKSGQGFYDYA